MIKITIIRPKEKANRFRKFKIIVDGHCVCRIKNEETKEILLDAGKHVIEAKIDWCGSNTLPFNIEDNGSCEFTVRSEITGTSMTDGAKAIWKVAASNKTWLHLERTG